MIFSNNFICIERILSEKLHNLLINELNYVIEESHDLSVDYEFREVYRMKFWNKINNNWILSGLDVRQRRFHHAKSLFVTTTVINGQYSSEFARTFLEFVLVRLGV